MSDIAFFSLFKQYDGADFSEVAVRLASTMRMNPWTVDGQPVDGAVVRLGVQLKLRAN